MKCLPHGIRQTFVSVCDFVISIVCYRTHDDGIRLIINKKVKPNLFFIVVYFFNILSVNMFF